ncbi:LCP family protein (plasmid) [Streptomyces sp. BI20]|uniref:LCP family protein n=1 Tax=Streptomyces sp. BI20 TaxID=3403460 RepID=UPI003C768B8F
MIWSAGVLAALVLAAGGAGGWLYQRLDENITGEEIGDQLGGDRPVNLSPGAKNILLVGSDTREGANASYGKDLTTMQSDTLMILHIAADRKWAAVVSLPRDSWVEMPECDRGDGTKSTPHHFKINSAYAIGGSTGDAGAAAACTIRTIEYNTGLRLDHFVTLDFQGFKGMVDALGGIEVCPPHPIHDVKARLDLGAGCQTVKGEQALGYVRTRYSVGDGSDIGRIGRQQEFMGALAARAKERLTSPGDVYGFMSAATKSVTTDSALAGLGPLYGLAKELQDIPKEKLYFVTVPNYPREADVPSDKANISWQYPQTRTLFRSLASDHEVTRDSLAAGPVSTAGSIQVRVLNGTTTPGRAAAVATQLRSAGYVVVSTGNAGGPVERTAITHPPGMEEKAAAFASRLRTTAAPVSSAQAAPRVVTLTVGADFAGLWG